MVDIKAYNVRSVSGVKNKVVKSCFGPRLFMINSLAFSKSGTVLNFQPLRT